MCKGNRYRWGQIPERGNSRSNEHGVLKEVKKSQFGYNIEGRRVVLEEAWQVEGV